MVREENEILGVCPHCTTVLLGQELLAKYTISSGTKILAECPKCDGIVDPDDTGTRVFDLNE